MDIPNIIKNAIGTKCTFASFVKDTKGNLKLKLIVYTENDSKKELRFNIDKELNKWTEQDLKDLLHVVFKQIFTRSWNKEAENLFHK